MLKSAVAVLAITIALITNTFAGTVVTPNTTLAAETGNNTSTSKLFTGSKNGNIGASNISKVDTRMLLYPGATTRIFAHMMPWFGGSNHMNVGYRSDDPVQVKKQVDDMMSRGIQGAIIDWYGPANTRANATTKYVMAEAAKRAGKFVFAVMEDVGALNKCAQTSGCSVTKQLISDLKYVMSTFVPSSAYMRINGRPVVFFFGVDRYSINWSAVKVAVPSFLFIHQNSSGFTHASTDGGYSWVGVNKSNPSDWGEGYIDGFYSKALQFVPLHEFGSTKKGFNDTIASWSQNRIMSQNCGQTWLNTFNEIGQYYNSGKQLESLQLVTWNDYEEGTEIESGIDGCLNLSAYMSGATVKWSVSGNLNALHHFTVFVSKDGQNLMKLGDVPASARSMDMGAYGFGAGAYTVYVKAVGKASIKNKMSAAVKWYR